MKQALLVIALGVGTAVAAPDPWAGGPGKPAPASSDLRGPAAEEGVALKQPLPAVPTFELPVAAPGAHAVQELLVNGKAVLGTEITVGGYVIWIYDCLTELQKPGVSRAKTQKLIDEDPTLCERKKLYLGDAKDTPLERGLWVVDVPRPPNKLEKMRLPKEEIASWPAVPKLSVGMYVSITGTFSVSSPHSERNSDGLLVWKSYQVATPVPLKLAPIAVPSRTIPALVAKAVAHPPKDLAAKTDSVKASNAGTKAYGQKQYQTAIVSYGDAVRLWDGNHIAWYGIAGAQIALGDWVAAEAAMRSAFEIVPTEPMYAMVYGYTVYNAAIERARADQARREGRKPEEVSPDLSVVDFEKAEQLLRHATTLNDKLWRAHYYLGRIARDGGRPKTAAEELTKALSASPMDPAPWVAIAELYRRWQRPDLAIATSSIGVLISGDADVWYELGMGFDDSRADAKAIDAFTKALEVKRDHAKSLFQRGRAYLRTGKRPLAKQDLEAFLKLPGPVDAFSRQSANRMLMELAAKK